MDATLIYLVGPSGSGKDSLLLAARQQLGADARVAFCHRYITRPSDTRPSDASGENHVCLSESEFLARQRAGLLALHWQSHGLHYGIGIEIDQWLALGVSPVINGSRQYLATAQARYPQLQCVEVAVSEPILRQRLLARNREPVADIDARLARNAQLRASEAHGAPHWQLDNNGRLEDATAKLVHFIQQHTGANQCASS